MMYSRNRRKGESVADYHARRIREADSRMPLPILAMMYDGNPPGHVLARMEPCPDCHGTGNGCSRCLGVGYHEAN